ncbi:MAG: EAL domain-containing protein [Pseudomonadota bacterium]
MSFQLGERAWFVGRSLRFQANRRMFLVGLIASLLLLAIGTLSYRFIVARELAQQQNLVQAYYANTLRRMEDMNHQSAVHLGSRLEFSRMLEQTGEGRWPKLTAFLNAQWAYNAFTNLTILDGSQRILFSYGSEADTLREHAVAGGHWLYVPRYHQFYRVYRVPLWLGESGQGELVLFKTLANSTMRELAIPQTHLSLVYAGKTVAASKEGMDAMLAEPSRYTRTEMPWNDVPLGDGPQPKLVVHRDIGDMLPFSNFVLWPVFFAVAVFITLFWLGLGRWLSATTARIASLGHGARGYAEGQDRASLVEAMKPAYRRDDEIRETAVAFEDMMQTLEARTQEQKSYLETLALLEEAVIEFDAECNIQRASPGWNKLSRRDDTLGRNLAEFIHPQDMETLLAQTARLHEGSGQSVALRLRLRIPDAADASVWVEARLLAFDDARGRQGNLRGVLRDITQTYEHEQQITHMALHDALTQLPNRVLLEDRFKVALRLASRHQHRVGVCFIDIDHFKVINDTLGHKAGDRLLVAFARRLAAQLRGGDTLARWGGDEFVLLLPDMDSESSIRQVTAKVVAAMQQPLELDGTDIRVTFSMGAAVFPVDGDNMETLFSHADQAMFHAKTQGRNQACYFQDMSRRTLGKKQLFIQNRLAAAIDQEVVEAWFQPIVHAETGCCTAVEALARWHDAEHGWISPTTFIPLAENLGLIHVLGSKIILSSLDAYARLRARGLDMVLAVNVSKRQLFIRSFPEWLLAEVRRRNLEPGQIVLEVTESVALNDVESGAIRVQELRQAGFLIAIDDFGTGYSSLSQLHEMHAVELKIDISFVRRLHDPAGRNLVQAIVNMAHALGMKTVAEGVERSEDAETLRRMGVSCLQGFLFGKPMPLDALETWLETHRHGCAPATLPDRTAQSC